MDTKVLRRASFQNDQPATKKQIAYINDMLNSLHNNAADATYPEVTTIVAAMELPATLTSYEASGIIETLRNYSGTRNGQDKWHTDDLVHAFCDVIEARMASKQAREIGKRIGLLAFERAVQMIVANVS